LINDLRLVVSVDFDDRSPIPSLFPRCQNVSLQKEVIVLKSELSTHRLMVRYLNNQLSGRIQQVQLLTRDKKDDNFDQVWNDLESEILFNKFKTIVRAFQSNSNVQYLSLFCLFQPIISSSNQNSPLRSGGLPLHANKLVSV